MRTRTLLSLLGVALLALSQTGCYIGGWDHHGHHGGGHGGHSHGGGGGYDHGGGGHSRHGGY